MLTKITSSYLLIFKVLYCKHYNDLKRNSCHFSTHTYLGFHRALYTIKLERSPFNDAQWIYTCQVREDKWY